MPNDFNIPSTFYPYRLFSATTTGQTPSSIEVKFANHLQRLVTCSIAVESAYHSSDNVEDVKKAMEHVETMNASTCSSSEEG